MPSAHLQPRPTELADTGSNAPVGLLISVGVLLLALGGALFGVKRRRARSNR
jgi:LPXTG-motif cell wall-anchored protein